MLKCLNGDTFWNPLGIYAFTFNYYLFIITYSLFIATYLGSFRNLRWSIFVSNPGQNRFNRTALTSNFPK